MDYVFDPVAISPAVTCICFAGVYCEFSPCAANASCSGCFSVSAVGGGMS